MLFYVSLIVIVCDGSTFRNHLFSLVVVKCIPSGFYVSSYMLLIVEYIANISTVARDRRLFLESPGEPV